jgi:hypothetical protein
MPWWDLTEAGPGSMQAAMRERLDGPRAGRPGPTEQERLPRESQVAVSGPAMRWPVLQHWIRRSAQDSGETRDLQMSQRPATVQSALPLRISGPWPEDRVPAAAETTQAGSTRSAEVLAWVGSPSKTAPKSRWAAGALTMEPRIRSASREEAETGVRGPRSASPREVSAGLWVVERLPRMAQRHSALVARRLALPPAAAPTA